MGLTERHKRIALAVLIGLIVFFLDLNVILIPLWTKRGEAVKEAGAIRQRLEDLKRGAEQLPAKRQQLEALRRHAGGPGDVKKAPHTFPEVLEQLSEFALETGVKLESLRPVQEETSPGQSASAPAVESGRETKFLLTAQSGYHDLGHFMRLIEQETPTLRVTGLTIAVNERRPRIHDVTLRLALVR